MKKIGLMSAMSMVHRYPRLSQPQQRELQYQRLQNLVAYALFP